MTKLLIAYRFYTKATELPISKKKKNQSLGFNLIIVPKQCIFYMNQVLFNYRISANNCHDNYSFLEALGSTIIQGRQLFKGGNY